jgi:hypothetical protein
MAETAADSELEEAEDGKSGKGDDVSSCSTSTGLSFGEGTDGGYRGR